uniref:Uncharacterized protein n=1 Tax=Knipowitschia caucasica TaxID=637954 RepID=A0AAV2L8J0_KNICA
MAAQIPDCVVNGGTGHTKLGCAGNKEPQLIIPSCVLITSASSGVKQEMPESPQMKEESEEHGIKQEEDEQQIAVREQTEQPCLLQEIPESPQTKEDPEEQRMKREEQLPVCVKTEESSLLQPRQHELREETQGEDMSSETEGDTDHSSDYEDEEEAQVHHLQPLSSDTDYEDNPRQIQNGARETAAQNFTHREDKPYRCSVCLRSNHGNSARDFHILVLQQTQTPRGSLLRVICISVSTSPLRVLV